MGSPKSSHVTYLLSYHLEPSISLSEVKYYFHNSLRSLNSSPIMPGGVVLSATADASRVEAPVSMKAYLMCAFAAFGGIFFGYDSGYISGVQGMNFFITQYTGKQPPLP